MQKELILKYNGRNIQTELKRVSFPPITKLKEVIKIDGFGNVPVHENTGKYDKSKVTLWTTSATITIDANKTSVDARLRRLRKQEAEKLDEIDQQIAELRTQREKLLQEAWNKANVVTVKELLEKA